MPRSSQYVHGTAPREQRRLTHLNRLMNAACLREMNLKRGDHVVDFGAGLGQLSRDMARVVGRSGRVVGIEFSREQIAEARRQAAAAGEAHRVDFREGDVADPPLGSGEWGKFDVAHARFILEHVSDPLLVVRQMMRALKPGGRILLLDDDHDVMRLWPEPPGFGEVWRAYQRTYDRLGNDPIIGRRLVQLLHEAGAKPVRNTWIFFGACAGQAEFLPLVENLAGVVEGAREQIVTPGMVEGSTFDETLRELRGWGKRPDAAIWFSICWAEGVKGRTAKRRG